MKIYYDGLNLEKYHKHPKIEGFTTNCTFFSQNDINNYNEFYIKNKPFIEGKSISFQTWEDGELGINQIKEIHQIDKDIFVKIPIINSIGELNDELINYAINNNIPINITAIYTFEQIDKCYEFLKNTNLKAIISVFAGPISDTGLDPSPYILRAKTLFKDFANVDILWAGCRELYSITRAEELDCDIATVPGDIVDKMNLFEYDLTKLSLERVNKFKNDAISGKITI
jgi:transaldolase